MSKKFPTNPAHPERTCWGCDLYCSAHSMACGNGADRTQHPAELFGEDWQEWGIQTETKELSSKIIPIGIEKNSNKTK